MMKNHGKELSALKHVLKNKMLGTELELNFIGDSNWGASAHFKTNMSTDGTRIWFIAAGDGEAKTHLAHSSMPKIEVEAGLLNGNSHISDEYSYILIFHVISLIAFIYLFGNTLVKFYNEYQSENNLEDPMLILIIGIFGDIWCGIFTSIYLYLVYSTGEVWFLLDIFGRLSYIFAQVAIVWVLLMIGYGWTIIYKTMDEKDIYIILALFVLMVHLMITALTFVDDDEYHKYHDFGGIQGGIIVGLRLLMFLAYSYGFYTTYTEASKKKRDAIWRFGIIATVYILSYPVLWILSGFFAPHLRRRMITLTHFTIQIAAVYYLMTQFSGKNTSYYKASEKSAGILPGTKYD